MKPQTKYPVRLEGTHWKSEAELVEAAALKDPTAQKDLVKLLMQRVRNLSVFVAGKRQDPEDLAQNALIEILKSVGSFRGESSLARWADRIVVHTSYKVTEKAVRRDKLWNRHGQRTAPEMPLADDALMSKHVKARMAILLRTISPDRRKALVLHHVQGYSIIEVAQMTDALPNTVRDRLQVGRRELRKKIANDPLLNEWREKTNRGDA